MSAESAYEDAHVLEEFLAETEEHLDALDAQLLQLEGAQRSGSGPTEESINEAFRATHTIKGLAAMLELTTVRDIAHSLENVLAAIRSGRIDVGDAPLELLFEGTAELRRAVTGILRPSKRVADASGIVRRVDDFLGRDPSLEPVCDTGQELSEYARSRIAHAHEEGLRPVRMLMRWGIELRLGALRLDVLERVLGRGEVLDIRPLVASLPVLDEIDPDTTEVEIEVVALTDLTDVEISDALGIVTSSITSLELENEHDTVPAQGDAPRTSSLSERVVRVDIGRLDDLMDLAGEIVTARTRLNELAVELAVRDRKDPLTQALALSVKDIGALVDILQEHVMSLRMVPARQLFSKFPRSVRDLARRSGKEITLVFEGEDTEIDKRLIEQIEDSVLHMVRNACDHGIESPDRRRASGKPDTGIVTIAAFNEGNHVMIEVRDDGRGLDVDAIVQRASAAGMIDPSSSVDEAALANLVMTTGFSTAEKVTDISGRGVGLDVVRKKASELGGSIRITSAPDKGTTISLRLPVTLAILPSLLVGDGERLFAIPLSAVSEVVRVRETEIRHVNESSMMDLRGKTMAVIRLSDALGIRENHPEDDRRLFVVVVSATGNTLGLAVDSLVAQQQVVVKNLEDAVGPSTGIGGATILGDGTVVPIVDIDGVIKLVSTRITETPSAGGGTE